MQYSPMGKAMDVLLVEDNPGDVRLTQEALREGKIAVNLSVAKDGIEAVDFLHRRGKFQDAPRPELILLDLNLPRRNGREVLSEIKADPNLRRIPTVIMTTSSADQDVETAYSLNANCFMTKPMELDDYMAMIHAIEDFWFTQATLPPH